MAAPVREFEFEMPIGHVDEDGRVHRTAVLRKMTGRDEAVMTDKRNRNNGAKLVTELLGNCIVRIGDIERPGPKVAQQLYSADRHYLLIKLREVTFGPDMPATYACPTCKSSTAMDEDLSTLPVHSLTNGDLPDDIVVELEDGYVSRDGDVYSNAVFRYPTGTDEERIATQSRENPSLGKNALMARCLRALGDMPEGNLQALGTAIFSDMTLSDRGLIDEALNGPDGPGVRMQRAVVCSNCGRDFQATLDMSSFLTRS
jgi:hypothetical protein